MTKSLASRTDGVNGPARTVFPSLCATLAMVTTLSVATPVSAHPEFVPSEINRYVKVDLLSPTRVRIVFTRMIGAVPALPERQLVDRNGDGQLDEHEKAELGARALEIAKAGLYVELDGAVQTLSFQAPEVGLQGAAVDASPFSVDLIATLTVTAAPHRLRIEDRTTVERSSSESELRIADSPSVQVVAAYRGTTGSGREMQFVFRGPKRTSLEDRSVTIELAPVGASADTVAPTPAKSPNRWWWIGLFVVGVAASALGAWRYRNMKG